ncbi:MAG: tRNA pseudouridine(38-40) synthase TruA [Planctomycetota bacterium]
MTVAYDGSAFHGWQKQEPPGSEPLRTVQGVLEDALVRLLKTPREVLGLTGASRTDTGVHAEGQRAVFDAATPIPVERLHQAITSRLPEDIEVRVVEPVASDFDVIGAVTSKQYRYRLWTRPTRPLGVRHLVYPCIYELETDRMNDAAARLVGTHDLEGLANAGHGRTTTVRTVHGCHVEPGPNDELHIVVSGSGFLYNTVRILAGTLVEIGRGHFEPSRMDEILATGDRALAGPTLTPNGLCLQWIAYGESGLTPRSQDAKTPRNAISSEGVDDVA